MAEDEGPQAGAAGRAAHLTTWFTLVISVAAIVSASVVGVITNSRANDTAIATARINAENYDRNQTRSFLRVQRQDAYSRFDTAAQRVFLTQKDHLDTFRADGDAAARGSASDAAHDALVAYYSVVPQVEMLASPEMYDFLHALESSLRDYLSMVADTIALLEANPGQNVDDVLSVVRRERYPDSAIDPNDSEPGYVSSDFLDIARRDMGNTDGF